MLKWLGRIVYIMIVTLLTVQIYTYGFYSKLQSFYQDHMEAYVDQDDIYLKGMNALTDIYYYQNEPIYTFNSQDPDYQFHFSIRAIGARVNQGNQVEDRVDGLMFFFNKVQIKEIDDPIIRMTIFLSQASILTRDDSGEEKLLNQVEIIYRPSLGFPESNIPALFLLNVEGSLIIPETDIMSSITMVKLEYSNGSTDQNDRLIFDGRALFIAANATISEGSYQKDEAFIIHLEDYALMKNFENRIPSAEDVIQFGLVTDREDISKYNGIIWRTMIGYIAIVMIVTYFIFFHKKTMERVRSNKSAKFRETHGSKSIDKPIVDATIFKEKDGE